ncbi:hypothetical protein ACGGZK_16220 [Agromyces sp. MMS24-K17]|uniref:hypothetical protein n=1 Tax=Agromyces sp. MMS24-K17 TaxID=3372850 RepID=UPI003754BC4B
MSAPDPEQLADGLRRAADAAEPGAIDLDAVLARSRAARRVRRSAVVGATTAVAVLALGGGLVLGLRPFAPASTTADAPAPATSAEAGDGAGEIAGDDASAPGVAPEVEPEADDVAVGRLGAAAACGRPAPDASAPGPLGLAAEVVGTTIADGTATTDVVVRNTGDERVAGRVGAVQVAVVADGAVVEAGTASAGVPIDLGPGASVAVAVPAAALRCEAAALPTDGLAAVATVAITVDGGASTVLVVSSPGPVEVG